MTSSAPAADCHAHVFCGSQYPFSPETVYKPDPSQAGTAAKFRAVLETAAFCEAELSEYCRRKAVHPEQLRQWRAACEGANGDGRPVSGSTPVVNPSALERLRELERELRRKDAALAEAAALLMLRKKADAIWGTEEDE